MRIWKYPLKVEDDQCFMIPFNGEVLSVINQKGNLVLYALVDETETRMEDVNIKIIGTGNWIDDEDFIGYKFINTVQLADGNLVFHIFKLC